MKEKRFGSKEREGRRIFFFYSEALCTRFEASTVSSNIPKVVCEVKWGRERFVFSKSNWNKL